MPLDRGNTDTQPQPRYRYEVVRFQAVHRTIAVYENVPEEQAKQHEFLYRIWQAGKDLSTYQNEYLTELEEMKKWSKNQELLVAEPPAHLNQIKVT